jgi:uncharacterized membrane protein YhaH (DUF805 family)
MLNSYISTFKKYVQFSGRATRSEFWTFTLGNLVISIVISILGMILAQISDSLTIISSLLSVLFSLATLLPGISVLVRRLHDTGRSGWWYWIALVPLAGPIILLVFLCTDSKEGENQFGPNPKKAVKAE